MRVDINISKKFEIIIKCIIILSWPFLGLFLCISENIGYSKYTFLSIFLTLLLILPHIKIKNIKSKALLLAVLLSCYMDRLLLNKTLFYINEISNKITQIVHIKIPGSIAFTLFSLIIFPSIVCIIYLFVIKILPKFTKILKSLDKNEKRYLLIVGILGLLFTSIISLKTSVFQKSIYNGVPQDYDVIYTSDNGYLSACDAWFNVGCIENDIRQPLFGIFSLPISLPTHIFANLLFFIPEEFAYETLMSVVQFLLLALSTILIVRLLKLKEKDKKYVYAFFSLSYIYLLFGLVLEQYVISLFYLILAIYLYYNEQEEINYTYIGAVGTMLTSGIIFPLISKYKTIESWLINISKCFIAFIITLTLSGQFSQILTFKNRMNFLKGFTAGTTISFTEKLYQYTHFIENLFKINPGKIRTNGIVSYMLNIPTSYSIFGITILSLMLISVILNRKNKTAVISFCWVLFSFFVLVIIGWGIAENGLILYSLYFAWAFYILYILFIRKIFKNDNIFHIIIILSTIIMFIYSSLELYNILKFAFEYYPR